MQNKDVMLLLTRKNECSRDHVVFSW